MTDSDNAWYFIPIAIFVIIGVVLIFAVLGAFSETDTRDKDTAKSILKLEINQENCNKLETLQTEVKSILRIHYDVRDAIDTMLLQCAIDGMFPESGGLK